jgi:hypothetical protein
MDDEQADKKADCLGDRRPYGGYRLGRPEECGADRATSWRCQSLAQNPTDI